MCFLPKPYKDYLIENPTDYQIASTNRVFQLISANLLIRGNSEFYSGQELIDGYISTISIADSSIHDISVKSSYLMKLTGSQVSLDSVSFTQVSSAGTLAAIGATLETTILVENTTFADSTVSFIDLISSYGSFDELTIQNVTAEGSIFNTDKAFEFFLDNSNFTQLHSANELPLNFYRSQLDRISNLSISNINQTSLSFRETEVTIIDGLTVSDCLNHVEVVDSSLSLITNSTFERLSSNSTLRGGAVLMQNSNVTINASNFTQNEAQNGGALFFS